VRVKRVATIQTGIILGLLLILAHMLLDGDYAAQRAPVAMRGAGAAPAPPWAAPPDWDPDLVSSPHVLEQNLRLLGNGAYNADPLGDACLPVDYFEGVRYQGVLCVAPWAGDKFGLWAVLRRPGRHEWSRPVYLERALYRPLPPSPMDSKIRIDTLFGQNMFPHTIITTIQGSRLTMAMGYNAIEIVETEQAKQPLRFELSGEPHGLQLGSQPPAPRFELQQKHDILQFGIRRVVSGMRAHDLRAHTTADLDTARRDTDGDGLPDRLEQRLGLDPLGPDTDADRIPDLWEANPLAPLGRTCAHAEIYNAVFQWVRQQRPAALYSVIYENNEPCSMDDFAGVIVKKQISCEHAVRFHKPELVSNTLASVQADVGACPQSAGGYRFLLARVRGQWRIISFDLAWIG